jgi:aspartyl-tRNA(Asn)/glutamyl-tRNA(Gln) amidotransferase subunit A
MAGNDPKDSTTIQKELPDYTKFLSGNIASKVIGIPREFYGSALDPEVASILEEAKKTYQKMGAKVIDVSLPLTDYAIATYYILVKSEASSNLSRYDGIHYGLSERAEKTLEEIYYKSRSEGFGREVKRSIMLGTYTLSAGYFDAYYKKAAKVRTLIRKEYEKVFKECDVLLAPVSPFPAFKRGEKMDDPLAMYLADINTGPINIAGVPAMSLPAGFTKAGLPVGMQLIGPMYGEDKLFNFGYVWQQETDWHKRKPNL